MTQTTDWADDAVRLDSETVRYRSAGSGDALLVVAGSASSASPALDLLAAERHVVVAELMTDPAQPARELGASIAAFCAALDLGSLAVLATGAGAIAALWTAVDNPGLVTTLVLEAPTLFGSDTQADLQLVDAMPQCEVPTLVLLGQRDPVSSPEFAADYKRLPASSVAIVYAAGADIKGERPEAFSDTVSDYLRRGQAFVLSTASTLIHAREPAEPAVIVSIDPATEPGATVVDNDNLTRLHVETAGADDAQVAAALQGAGLGYLEGEHAWLSVAALREQGAGQSSDWSQRYDAMITYAVGKGWASADGNHVQAHLERTQRKADA